MDNIGLLNLYYRLESTRPADLKYVRQKVSVYDQQMWQMMIDKLFYAFACCKYTLHYKPTYISNITYSGVPNRQTGLNKHTGWKIL